MRPGTSRFVARAFWVPIHCLWSLLAWTWFLLARRRGTVVFSHYQDLDADGRDRQLGPLVDALSRRGPLVEVTLVPLSRLFDNLRAKRRPFVSHAAILALARLLDLGGGRDPGRRMTARVQAARLLLRSLAPRSVCLIDESGSGQPLLRAARQLGIRVVGVQHGDFRSGDPAYDLRAGRDVEPADELCVWSRWFRDRLYAISPIYADHNTRVTGRLRYPVAAVPRAAGAVLRVLVMGQADDAWPATVAPYLAGLEAATDIQVRVRAHPARAAGSDKPRSLAEDLQDTDVVIGAASSALLEAIYMNREVVVLGPSGLADDIPVTRCSDPGEIVSACRVAGRRQGNGTARAVVWGDVPEDPVAAILESLDSRTANLRS